MRAKDMELEKLLELLKKYDLTELTVKNGRCLVTLKKESPKGGFFHQAIHGIDDTMVSGNTKMRETVPMAKGDSPLPETTQIQETKFQLAANIHEVKAPLVGTFYRAPASDADPFVEEDDLVEENDKLCIVEAMKIMNEIESPVRGYIREICAKNGSPVEFGQVLFRIEVKE